MIIDTSIGFRLYDLLAPTLLDHERFQCVIVDEQLAVLVLEAPAHIAVDEMRMAEALHRVLRRGVLVVF